MNNSYEREGAKLAFIEASSTSSDASGMFRFGSLKSSFSARSLTIAVRPLRALRKANRAASEVARTYEKAFHDVGLRGRSVRLNLCLPRDQGIRAQGEIVACRDT
jgi:hypothetical protein